jgi:ribosome recycling factor
MEPIVQKCEDEMNKAIEGLRFNLKTIRSGVVTPGVLDKITVLYYGEKTPLKAIAGVSSTNATQLVIKPYDPEAVKPICSAIGESDLGVNPVVNGMSIYLSFPALSGDRRQEFVKQAKGYADQAKNHIRAIRGDYVNKVQKDKTLSEDMQYNLKDDIQKSTDKFNKLVDTVFAEKEKELLTI